MSTEADDLVEYNAKRRAIGLLPVTLAEAHSGHHTGFTPPAPEDLLTELRTAGDALAMLLQLSKRGPLLSVDIDDALDRWATAVARQAL